MLPSLETRAPYARTLRSNKKRDRGTGPESAVRKHYRSRTSRIIQKWTTRPSGPSWNLL